MNMNKCLHVIKTMFIMRGLPGSGKSYLAQEISHCIHLAQGYDKICLLSTDDMWTCCHNYHYFWDVSMLGQAHKLCQLKARLACERAIPTVIIDNTNTTWKEVKPYVDIALANNYIVEFVEPKTEWKMDVHECFKKNSHGVPLESIIRMRDRFQPTSELEEKLK